MSKLRDADPKAGAFADSASFTLSCNGQRRTFTYPGAADTGQIVERILRGKEYPIVPLPDYAPRVVFDVGANVGAAAILFATSYPAAEVYCYEPSARCIPYLERNIAGLSNVRVFDFGLSDRDRDAKLYRGKNKFTQNSVIPNFETTGEYDTVRLRSAGDVLKESASAPGVILKIDTEGSEVPILQSYRPHLPNTDMVYLEYHSEHDRRTVEGILGPEFILTCARASYPHRGTLMYFARRLAERYPQIDTLRIGDAG